MAHHDPRFHPKEVIIGVRIGSITKAYPLVELAKAGTPVVDRLGTRTLTVVYDAHAHAARILDSLGKEFPSITGYWFAWMAFHPQSLVYRAPSGH